MRPTDASSSPHATSVSTSRFDTLSAKIAVVEARAPPTVHVVAQAEIRAQIGARDLAGARGVRFQQNFLFYAEAFVSAENCARFGRLRHGRVIAMSAIGDIARECQHLWAECGDDRQRRIGRSWRAVLRMRHCFNVGAHGRHWSFIDVTAYRAYTRCVRNGHADQKSSPSFLGELPRLRTLGH